VWEVNLGLSLQVIGGALEALSVIALAIGITKTRAAFLDRPAWFVRVIGRMRRWLQRLFRRPVVIHARGASILAAAQASGRATVKPDWSRLGPQESVQRLQEISDRHEEAITDLLGRIERESRERAAAYEEEQTARNELGASLNRRIVEAATGGLKYEAWGASFLALGIGLTLLGLIVG
jgi:hypothetical protein